MVVTWNSGRLLFADETKHFCKHLIHFFGGLVLNSDTTTRIKINTQITLHTPRKSEAHFTLVILS